MHLPPLRLLLVAALVTLGCANMHDVMRDKEQGGGTWRVYSVSAEQAWKITDTILKIDKPSAPVEEKRGENYVLLQVQSSSLSSATYLGIWVEPVSPGETKVTFVRKIRSGTERIRALTSEQFHREFEALMEFSGASCASGAPAASAPAAAASGLPAAASSSAPSAAPAASAASAAAPAASSAAAPPAASAPPATTASAAPAVREIPLPPRRVH
jgi:hypothetical protein